MDVFWWCAIVVLFLLGYAGLFVPGLPDVPFLFVGFLIYHFMLNDEVLGWVFWSIVIVATVVLFLIDYFASGFAAQKAGGSKWSIPAAAIGVLVFMWFPPVGFLIGPVVTVFLVEFLTQQKTPAQAFKIAISTLVGFLGGIIVKFLLLTAMILWFLLLIYF